MIGAQSPNRDPNPSPAVHDERVRKEAGLVRQHLRWATGTRSANVSPYLGRHPGHRPPAPAGERHRLLNLTRSEQLVWILQNVDCPEPVVRRGTSHGVSIQVDRGLYYRPSTFRSRPIEWEESVHADTGMLGLTTRHIYFAGSRKRFRVRYDKIVAFEPFSDGFGIMRDAQTARPQAFRAGDGWFAYNLAANLAQVQG